MNTNELLPKITKMDARNIKAKYLDINAFIKRMNDNNKKSQQEMQEGFSKVIERNNNADKYDWNRFNVYDADNNDVVGEAQRDLLNSTDCIYITYEQITALLNGQILGFKDILIKLKKEV